MVSPEGGPDSEAASCVICGRTARRACRSICSNCRDLDGPSWFAGNRLHVAGGTNGAGEPENCSDLLRAPGAFVEENASLPSHLCFDVLSALGHDHYVSVREHPYWYTMIAWPAPVGRAAFLRGYAETVRSGFVSADGPKSDSLLVGAVAPFEHDETAGFVHRVRLEGTVIDLFGLVEYEVFLETGGDPADPYDWDVSYTPGPLLVQITGTATAAVESVVKRATDWWSQYNGTIVVGRGPGRPTGTGSFPTADSFLLYIALTVQTLDGTTGRPPSVQRVAEQLAGPLGLANERRLLERYARKFFGGWPEARERALQLDIGGVR